MDIKLNLKIILKQLLRGIKMYKITYESIEKHLDNLKMVIDRQWPNEELLESCLTDPGSTISGRKYTFLFVADLNKFPESCIRDVVLENYGIYFDEKIKNYTNDLPEKERNIYFETEVNNLNIYIEIFC